VYADLNYKRVWSRTEASARHSAREREREREREGEKEKEKGGRGGWGWRYVGGREGVRGVRGSAGDVTRAKGGVLGEELVDIGPRHGVEVASCQTEKERLA
jgi:hypothetical protein